MTKSILATAVLVLFASPGLAQFGGSIVFDPHMFVRQLQQLNEEIAEAKSMAQEVQYTIKNITSGSAGVWGSNLGYLDSLGTIISTANGLSYQSAELEQQFQQLYPGYSTPPSGRTTLQQSTNIDLNTLNGTLQDAQAAEEQWSSEQATLDRLETKNATAIGNLQVAQAGNEISMQTLNLLASLQQIAMATMNAQNVNAANQLNAQVVSQQTAQAIVGAPPQVLQMDPGKDVIPER